MLANRLQSMERNVAEGGGGKGGGKEVNVVDIKTLKPPMFKGTSSDSFPAWAKKANNYLDSNCDGIRRALEKIEFEKEMIDEFALESLELQGADRIDKQLNQFLLAYTDLAAMTSVENAHGSGFEAWRRLTAEYDPMSAQAGFNKMGNLMHPPKSKNEFEVSMRVEQWEAEEKRYNDRTRNKIPDGWRLEILVAMLPTALEQESRMRIVTPEPTYSGIRQRIMDHVHRLTSISGRRQATPMDCSILDQKTETSGKGTGEASGPAGVPSHDHEGEALWTFEYDPAMPPDFDQDLNCVAKGGGKV